MSRTGRVDRRAAISVALVLLAAVLGGCLDPSDDEVTGPDAKGRVDTNERPGDEVVEGGAGVDVNESDGIDEAAEAVEPFRGTATVDMGAEEGVLVQLENAGWARVDLTSRTSATFHVHATRPTPDGPISVLAEETAGMGPDDFLSITFLVTDEAGTWMPMYDLLVWGLSQELRNKTGPDEGMLGFLNPGDIALGPDTRGVLVASTSLDGVEVSLVPEGAEAAARDIIVHPITHPGLVAHYAENGESTHLGALGLLAIEDREEFSDVELRAAGIDGVIVWQSGEGGARYGSMDHEMGRRTEEGDCAPSGGMQKLFVDEDDPTGPTPTLTWGASKQWIGEPGARSLCAAVSAQMVGGWERTGSGAWFFHAPFEGPAGF